MKIIYKSLLVLCLPFLLSSCALLPAEEEPLSPPLIRPYERRQHNFATVLRGDIVLTQNISMRFLPSRVERFYFEVEDELISNVAVNRGDNVLEGDILIELEHRNIDAQIADMENELHRARLEREHIQNLYNIYIRIRNAAEDNRDLSHYANSLENLSSEIEIIEIRLSELHRLREQRVIRSNIDGTVTFVRRFQRGERSSRRTAVASVSDKTYSVFVVRGEDAAIFTPGERHEIRIVREYHEAIVVSYYEIGLEEPAEETAYLMLLDEGANIQDNSYATFLHTIEERNNVLFVPWSAVNTIGDRHFVYIMDEDNIMATRDVSIRLIGNNVTEITAGLEEGDSVVID